MTYGFVTGHSPLMPRHATWAQFLFRWWWHRLNVRDSNIAAELSLRLYGTGVKWFWHQSTDLSIGYVFRFCSPEGLTLARSIHVEILLTGTPGKLDQIPMAKAWIEQHIKTWR